MASFRVRCIIIALAAEAQSAVLSGNHDQAFLTTGLAGVLISVCVVCERFSEGHFVAVVTRDLALPILSQLSMLCHMAQFLATTTDKDPSSNANCVVPTVQQIFFILQVTRNNLEPRLHVKGPGTFTLLPKHFQTNHMLADRIACQHQGSIGI